MTNLDKLRADRRFWSNPEYRANVIESIRVSETIKHLNQRIVKRLLTIEEQREALSAEFLLLNCHD